MPEPETDIEDTSRRMEGAGFNQTDTIALTACGHTLGRVHHGGFPQVVPESFVTPNNTGGGVGYDRTPTVFDMDVVNGYLRTQQCSDKSDGKSASPLSAHEDLDRQNTFPANARAFCLVR